MGNSIKSVSIFRIEDPELELTEDQIEKEGYIHSLSTYDLQGNIIKEVDFNIVSTIEHQTEFEYNDKNYLVKVNQYMEDEVLTEWRELVRNEEGRVDKELLHYLDGSIDVIEYSYNEANQLISRIQTNSDEEIEKQENNVYEDGKLIKEEIIDQDGNVTVLNTYSYAEKGILEESIHELFNDGKSTRLIHAFDEAGRRQKSLRYNDKNQLVEISRYVIDDMDRVVQIEDEDQHKKSLTTIEYDDAGNIVSQLERDKNDEIISSVERRYSQDNRVLESKVYMSGQGHRQDQEYTLIYKYEYFE